MAFESGDGCTLFPEGMLGYDWSECCDVHDIAFETGISVQDFLVANHELWQCVGTKSDIFFASAMLFGVMTGGGLIYFGSRWLKRRSS